MKSDTDLARRALADTTFDTYWLDSLDSVTDEPALNQKISCDLLIVGGGFCGLWAAIQAKQKDPERDVVFNRSSFDCKWCEWSAGCNHVNFSHARHTQY